MSRSGARAGGRTAAVVLLVLFIVVAVVEIGYMLGAFVTVKYRIEMVDDAGTVLAYLYDVLSAGSLILLFNLLYLLVLHYLYFRKRSG